MVKNTNGGNKTKHKARKDVNQQRTIKLDDLKATNDQTYAKITAVYGGGRYQVMNYDENQQMQHRIGICCGRIKRYTRPKLDDIVLIALRNFQDNKCDILHLYNRDELQLLLAHNEIEHSFVASSNAFSSSREGDDDVVFGQEEEDEDDVKDMWDRV